jgi:hypothetical protein
VDSAGRRVTLYGQIAGMIGGDSACHEWLTGRWTGNAVVQRVGRLSAHARWFRPGTSTAGAAFGGYWRAISRRCGPEGNGHDGDY